MSPMSTPGGPRAGRRRTRSVGAVPGAGLVDHAGPTRNRTRTSTGSWGPPRRAGEPRSAPGRRPRPRPGWLPLLAVILVTVLVAAGCSSPHAGGSAAVHGGRCVRAGGRSGDATAAADHRCGEREHAPAPTSRSPPSRPVARCSAGWTGHSATRSSGVVGIDHVDRMRFWRTTSSEIGNLGSSQQNVRVYRIDGAVELIAESDQGGADVYTPASGGAAGRRRRPGPPGPARGRWAARRYRSELRAAAAEPGCLRVSGTVVETTATAGPAPAERCRRPGASAVGSCWRRSIRGEVSVRLDTVSRPACRSHPAHRRRGLVVERPGAMAAARLRPAVGRRESGHRARWPGRRLRCRRC